MPTGRLGRVLTVADRPNCGLSATKANSLRSGHSVAPFGLQGTQHLTQLVCYRNQFAGAQHHQSEIYAERLGCLRFTAEFALRRPASIVSPSLLLFSQHGTHVADELTGIEAHAQILHAQRAASIDNRSKKSVIHFSSILLFDKHAITARDILDLR
jgi:hypothetical protein